MTVAIVTRRLSKMQRMLIYQISAATNNKIMYNLTLFTGANGIYKANTYDNDKASYIVPYII